MQFMKNRTIPGDIVEGKFVLRAFVENLEQDATENLEDLRCVLGKHEHAQMSLGDLSRSLSFDWGKDGHSPLSKTDKTKVWVVLVSDSVGYSEVRDHCLG
jgi:hypothetical protein